MGANRRRLLRRVVGAVLLLWLAGCVTDRVRPVAVPAPDPAKLPPATSGRSTIYYKPDRDALDRQQRSTTLADLPVKRQLRPHPIPDRLLVKIDPSQIADPFQAGSMTCRLPALIQAGIVPADIGIMAAEYRGLARDGAVVLALRLERVVDDERLRSAFRRTRAQLLEEAGPRTAVRGRPGRPAEVLAVAVDPAVVAAPRWAQLCPPNYVHLRSGSHLNHAFRSIGVLSMRRVFRSVEQSDPARPGQFTVRRLKDLLSTAKQLNPQRSARAAPTTPIPDNMENWFVLRLGPGVDADGALAKVKTLVAIQNASLDFPIQLAQPSDPEWSDQWGLRNTGTFQGSAGGLAGFDINIEPAWAATGPPQPVVVAIVDTGFSESLNELANRLWTNGAETPNGQDDDCNGYIDDLHGVTTYDRFAIDYSASPACSVSPGGPSTALEPHATRVAGVIAAQANNAYGIAGTAGTDNVQLMNIAIGTTSGREWPPGWSDVAEGIWYAVSPTVQPLPGGGAVRGADIINMSFTCPRGVELIFEALAAAADAGVIAVASAGNGGDRFVKTESRWTGVYPAAMPGVISVGGVTRAGRKWPSSNYGPGVDLVAPAAEVRTLIYTTPTQTNAEVSTAAGTSLSAAFVSGGAAVVLGRYPTQLSAPYMRVWLRGKARDILDPLGDGSVHAGDDEWTGAGMLNIGDATTALGNVNDQPVLVQLVIERSRDYARPRQGWQIPTRPFPVGGRPDLGIRVQGSSLRQWSLAYGVGDSPATWTTIPVDPTLTQQQITAPITGPDIPSGRNYFDTDPLVNGQLYTVRLQAENLAGTRFTVYDSAVPSRARLVFPPPNWTLVPAWGWLPAAGFIDVRPSSSYTFRVIDDANQLVWQGGPYAYTWPEDRTATAAYALMGNFGDLPAQFGLAAASLSEGWKRYRLTVQSSAGVDQDTVRLYVDTSHLPADYWPLTHEPVQYPVWCGSDPCTANLADDPLHLYWRGDDLLLVNGAASESEPRVVLYVSKSVIALNGSGGLMWEKRSVLGWPFHWPFEFSDNMVVDDVDGDGNSEVVYATTELTNTFTWQHTQRLFLLNAEDGSSYGAAWPVASPRTNDWRPGSVATADVLDDSRKEIIHAEPRHFYYGIPEAELAQASVRVLDTSGAVRWSRQFPIEVAHAGPIRTADVDADGRAEILLVGTGQMLRGNNTFLVGWDVRRQFYDAAFVRKQADATLDVLLWDGVSVHLKSPSGATLAGWPIGNVRAMAVGQTVAGGDEEIAVCETSIRVFDRTGSRVAAIPEIQLGGRCAGLKLTDLDQDGSLEFVALVDRFPDNPAPTERVGHFLEAYRLDGTRLAATDNRWPVAVAPYPWGGRGPVLDRHITLGDADGDGRPEIIQLLSVVPYGLDQPHVAPSMRLEVLHPN